MFDFKKFSNLNREQFLELIYKSYKNNCTQFALDFTKLFTEQDGSLQVPYPKQNQIMNLISPNDRIVVVTKCRQSGISTAGAVAKPFHAAYFGKFPDIVLISSTKNQALKIMRRIKNCFSELPEILQPNFVVDTAQEIVLSNKSRIISLASNPMGVRGFTGIGICDEFAMHTEREGKELWEAMLPSTTKGGCIIAISTPFGNTGVFYDLSTKTLAEISGVEEVKFESVKINIFYEDVPYILDAVKNKGLFDGLEKDMIEQEYMLKFVVSDAEDIFFSKDFILSTLRCVDDIDMPLYCSYKDLNIPHTEYIGDHCENLDKRIDEKYYKTKEMRERYDKLVGGWDVASTSNDSSFKVHGRLREGYDKWEECCDMIVNRVNNRMHDTSLQRRYLKRVIQILDVDYVNVDSNGIGQGVCEEFQKDPDVGKKINAIRLQTEDKYKQFIRLKERLTAGNIKRRWENDKQTLEMLKQYTNLRLNKLTHSLKAKGALKDDAPYAAMLCQSDIQPVHSNIHFI